jgi:hypothetical protein
VRTVAWLNKKYGTLHRETGEPFSDEVRTELMPLCDQDAAEAVIYARGAALKDALSAPDFSQWATARFGVFHEDGRFEELTPTDPVGLKHPRGHTARWVGGTKDMELLRAAWLALGPNVLLNGAP